MHTLYFMCYFCVVILTEENELEHKVLYIKRCKLVLFDHHAFQLISIPFYISVT